MCSCNDKVILCPRLLHFTRYKSGQNITVLQWSERSKEAITWAAIIRLFFNIFSDLSNSCSRPWIWTFFYKHIKITVLFHGHKKITKATFYFILFIFTWGMVFPSDLPLVCSTYDSGALPHYFPCLHMNVDLGVRIYSRSMTVKLCMNIP